MRTRTLQDQIIKNGQPIEPLTLMSADDLFDLPEEEIEFLVEGWIPQGGLSLLIGQPKDGKSSFARQLAVDVAQGNEFLGQKTRQGRVLLFAFEESMGQVAKRLKMAGMQPGDPIMVHAGMLSGSDLKDRIKATLGDYEDVVLITFDTLFKLAKVRDANAYAEIQNALEWVHDMGTKQGITILGLHHSKKVATEDTRTSVKASGSNAIAGAANNLLDLSRQRQADPKSPRILAINEFRYGDGLEPVILSFDPDTQRYSIAGQVADEKKKEKEEGKKELRRRVLDYISDHPGCTMPDIKREIPGKAKTLHEILALMLDQHLVVRRGEGTRNHPYQYFATEVPAEPVQDEEMSSSASIGGQSAGETGVN